MQRQNFALVSAIVVALVLVVVFRALYFEDESEDDKYGQTGISRAAALDYSH